MLVVPVALALIFLILFSTFGSVRQAALVFVNIPFALIGGVFALLARRRVPVGAGLGRLHRAARHRGAQRRGAGLLLQPAAGAGHAARARRGRGRERRLRPVLMTASHRRLRPGAAAVRQRARLGDPAAAGHRRHRRPDHLHPADAGAAAHPLPTLGKRHHDQSASMPASR